MKFNSIKTLSAIALGLALQSGFAGNITDINVSVKDNQRIIKVKFDSGATAPSGFITSTPARIALDFPNTAVQLAQNNLSFDDVLLKQIITAQGEGKSRVLLNLGQEGQYNTEVKGNEVWIYVSNAGSGAQFSSSASAPMAQYTQAPPFEINFTKDSKNAGLIQFTSAYKGQIQAKRFGNTLEVLFKNYPLSAKDQKNFNVNEFSTPVSVVSVRRIGNDTKLIIQNRNGWDYRMETTGEGSGQIKISKEILNAKGAKEVNKHFSGKRISLDFQNISVRTILQILAKEANQNIVAADNVTGNMSLSLKDVPWDQALDLILDARDLGMKKEGNVINILPNDEIYGKEIKKAEDNARLNNLLPLVTRTFQLNYKKVEDFMKVIESVKSNNSGGANSNSNSIMSSRGSVMMDTATNTLTVTDIPQHIAKFEELVNKLDVSMRQVMIEARIVEAGETVSREIGVKFGINYAGATGIGTDLSHASSNYRTPLSTFSPNINLPAGAGIGKSSIALVRAISSTALGLELSALEEDNRTKTISNPRVLTQDRTNAVIEQGVEIPYTTRDAEGVASTAFKKANLVLDVTPQITPDNKVILDIKINKDDPDYSRVNGNGEPPINNKRVVTKAMVEDGGTIVVGGVYTEQNRNVVSKVPLLGDLPVVGNLFKSRNRSGSRNELLFFITPRVMGSESSVLRY